MVKIHARKIKTSIWGKYSVIEVCMGFREYEIGEKNKVVNQTLLKDIDKVEDVSLAELVNLNAITVTLQDISVTLARICDRLNNKCQ